MAIDTPDPTPRQRIDGDTVDGDGRPLFVTGRN